MGLRAHPDGTVVTPGQLMAAVRRVLHGQKAMSIPEALASYGRVFGPLAGIVSPRAVDIWGTMLSQLKQLQQEIGGQVGILTPHICGRWVCDILLGAVGTIGGPGLSLVDLIELGVGDGNVVKEHFVFSDLFELLVSEPVRAKVEWLSHLPGVAMKGKACPSVARGGVVADAGVGDVAAGGRTGPCYNFRSTGTCRQGNKCRFCHDN